MLERYTEASNQFRKYIAGLSPEARGQKTGVYAMICLAVAESLSNRGGGAAVLQELMTANPTLRSISAFRASSYLQDAPPPETDIIVEGLRKLGVAD